MKAIATICLLSFLTGVPGQQEIEPDILGVYEMVWSDGQFLPSGKLTSGSLEFRADGEWQIAWRYGGERAVGERALRSVATWGDYSVGEEKDGCTQFESWRAREEKTPNVICDGVVTWRESSFVAVFRKRR